MRRRRRGDPERRRWTVGDVLWLFVPVLAVLLIVAYFVAAATLGANPPFSVVSGQSMRPAFAPGDLVVIRGVAASELESGDIISIVPPLREQEEKGLPGEVVHRIVRVVETDGERTFLTKGDNNPGEDAFITFPGNVRGEVVARAPALGFPVLFARSDQGRIFALAAGLALIGYFLISAIERRQEAAALENPRALIAEVRDENHEMKEVVKELVGAVSTYGEHLKSHTGAVQGMSAASQELARVTAELRSSVAALSAPQAPAAPAATEEPGIAPASAEAAPDASLPDEDRPAQAPEPSSAEAADEPPAPQVTADEPATAERPPVPDHPAPATEEAAMPQAARPLQPEIRFEPPAPARNLQTELLDHLRAVATEGWLDLELDVLSSTVGAPAAVLEAELATLALRGHLRIVATRQSETYLVRLR